MSHFKDVENSCLFLIYESLFMNKTGTKALFDKMKKLSAEKLSAKFHKY